MSSPSADTYHLLLAFFAKLTKDNSKNRSYL